MPTGPLEVPLGPLGCEVGPLWIGHFLVHPTDAGLNGDLGNLEASLILLALFLHCLSHLFLQCGIEHCPAGGVPSPWGGVFLSAIVLEWRVQSNIHMVSQQNIALEQGDQCYSVRLSVVLILWLIDGACHLRHDIILNVENFKKRLRVLAVLNANFLQIFRPVVFTWTLEPLRKQQITLWFCEAFLMLHPNGRGHVWAAMAPRCRLSSKEFSRHHKDYFAR